MGAPADVLSRIDEIESELRGLSVEVHEHPGARHPGCRAHPLLAALRRPARAGAARRPGSAARRRDLRRAHPSLRGRAERRPRRARARDRVLAHRSEALRRLESILEGIARYQSSVRAAASSRDGAVAALEAEGSARARCRGAGGAGPRCPSRLAAATGQAAPGKPAKPRRVGRAARRGLGPARPARLRDHRRSRHGVRHHPALRARREPRLDHADDAGRVRRLRLRGRRRRRVLGAVALRPAADVARRRRRRHRGWLRNPCRRHSPLRPRARLARAAARRWPRRARRRDRDRVVVRDGGRDRAARCGARPCPAGDRHRAVVARGGVRGDHPRRNGRARSAASLAQAPDRDRVLSSERRLRCSRSTPTRSAGAGTTAVVASFVLVVLAAGIWLQLVSGKTDLDPLASSFVLAAVGLALLLVRPLWDVDRNQGIALAGAAVVWAVAWVALRRLQPALALVLGVSSLVACGRRHRRPAVGNEPRAHLVGRGAAPLLHRPADARCAPAGNRARLLRHHRGARAPRRCTAEADLRRARFRDGGRLGRRACRSPCSVQASSRPPRRWRAPRPGCSRGSPPFASGSRRIASGCRRASSSAQPQPAPTPSRSCSPRYSFRPGHLAATIVAAAVGVAAVAISSRRSSVELVAASLAWVGGVFAIATGFDVPEFAVDEINRSYGGWALIAASAGVLAACFAFQLLFREVRQAGIPAGGGVLALAGSAAGIALISPAGDVLESTWIGWRLLAAGPRPLRPRGERLPHRPPSRSRDDHVGARHRRAPRQRVARRARRDVARRRLRGHGGRARPALPHPPGAAALARRLDRRLRHGLRRHRRARRRLGVRRRRADALRDRRPRDGGGPRRPLRPRLGRQGAPRSRHRRLGDRHPRADPRRGVPRRRRAGNRVHRRPHRRVRRPPRGPVAARSGCGGRVRASSR